MRRGCLCGLLRISFHAALSGRHDAWDRGWREPDVGHCFSLVDALEFETRFEQKNEKKQKQQKQQHDGFGTSDETRAVTTADHGRDGQAGRSHAEGLMASLGNACRRAMLGCVGASSRFFPFVYST
ncbi:hypothetical protein BKA66DRAFT_294923 [Pyrenochaeta sp. MPI-SDFR-AT-0127]|nr:hypothetical protein BKA66DRAFT_294923 [Pyrenochaeta sp. MPI-SDFR-AT-0127]